jgi:hypothetical protein
MTGAYWQSPGISYYDTTIFRAESPPTRPRDQWYSWVTNGSVARSRVSIIVVNVNSTKKVPNMDANPRSDVVTIHKKAGRKTCIDSCWAKLWKYYRFMPESPVYAAAGVGNSIPIGLHKPIGSERFQSAQVGGFPGACKCGTRMRIRTQPWVTCVETTNVNVTTVDGHFRYVNIITS